MALLLGNLLLSSQAQWSKDTAEHVHTRTPTHKVHTHTHLHERIHTHGTTGRGKNCKPYYVNFTEATICVEKTSLDHGLNLGLAIY